MSCPPPKNLYLSEEGLEEYQYLQDYPYKFDNRTIRKLLSMIKEKEVEFSLHDYANWWYEGYYVKDKEGKPFPLIYSAIENNWDIKYLPYAEWGKAQIFT